MRVRVSAVVPTYRRPDLLERCLRALLTQDLEPAEYEVIVVDDAASPATRELVERLAAGPERPSLRYLPVHRRHGPAAARNLGWRAARGDVVAFTDDDTMPRPDWLRAGLAALGNGVAAASGQIVVPRPERPTDYELDAAGLERAEFATANCFCRRSALALLGGFDERFTAPWREDSDLHFSLLERLGPGQVVRAPEAVVVHPVRPAAWGVSLGQQRKSRFNALLYKKHPGLYRQQIQPAPPWRYYLSVLALLGAAGGLLADRPGLARPTGAAWLLLTGELAARRLRQTSRTPGHVAEMLATSALIPPLSVFWRLRGALEFRVWFL